VSTNAELRRLGRKRGRRPIGYRVEAAVAYLLYELFRVLPFDWASALGGLIGRTLGPRMGVTHRALRNLERALPETSPAERTAIVRRINTMLEEWIRDRPDQWLWLHRRWPD
jgi:lauroyl/myristoyl acyltransferase